ncbi:DUF3592 domain-containing protein [Streptomyces sp. NPDC047046]|uniref:DUF3592 domain-containing protein n=1 Tax=Streptomyces sp. NPDC047046 TaxID=3155378 RepID=UPI0033F4F377
MRYGELALDLSGGRIWAFSGGFVWIGIGICLSLGEVWRGWRRRETVGRCVMVMHDRSANSYSYMFEDPADPTIVSHLKGDGVRRHFREGERVTLSYDPKNHRDTKLAEDRTRLDPWWGVLYVSPFGLIPLALAWVGLSLRG